MRDVAPSLVSHVIVALPAPTALAVTDEIVGGAESSVIVSVNVGDQFPDASLYWTATVLAPSPDESVQARVYAKVSGVENVPPFERRICATELPASVALNVSVTLTVDVAFAPPLIEIVPAGAPLSTRTRMACDVVALPAASRARAASW